MTNDDESALFERLSESRRSLLKKGTLATGAVALGGAGTVAAQEGDDVIFGNDPDENTDELFNQDEAMSGLMFRQHFIPAGLFTVASPVTDFTPDVEGVEDNVWADYNTRTIQYLHPLTTTVPLFPQDSAELGPFEEEFGAVVDDDFVENDNEVVIDGEPVEEGGIDETELRQLRPTIFALNRDTNFFGDEEYIVEVEFSPIPEENEEAVFNRFQDEFFPLGGPFGPDAPGPLEGNQTASGNETDTS